MHRPNRSAPGQREGLIFLSIDLAKLEQLYGVAGGFEKFGGSLIAALLFLGNASLPFLLPFPSRQMTGVFS